MGGLLLLAGVGGGVVWLSMGQVAAAVAVGVVALGGVLLGLVYLALGVFDLLARIGRD